MRVTTLLVGSILLFMVGSTAARTTRIPNASRPLSAADVEHGLKSAVPNARMAELVKKYGVDFELTGAVKQELRAAGASDNLILQIGRSRAPIPRPPIPRPPIPIDVNSGSPTGHSASTHAHRSANTPRAHVQPAQSAAKELLSQADKYRLGSGVVRNEAKAAQLYRKAAGMGNAEAETRFAEALFDGRGVRRDPAESRAWLEKAARQGNVRGECNLGVMLTGGLDIAQDRAKGFGYLQAAARLGDGYAEDRLGQFAESGL